MRPLRWLLAEDREVGPLELAVRFVGVLGLFVSPLLIMDPPVDDTPGLAQRTPPEVTTASPVERLVVLGDSTGEFLGRAFLSLPVNISNWGAATLPAAA